MPGAAAEVHEPALGEHDDALAVGEDDVVDLRLDVLPLGTAASEAMSISLSKWPMLQTIASCFIRRMWSWVITFTLPVAVTKMSALSQASSIVTTR